MLHEDDLVLVRALRELKGLWHERGRSGQAKPAPYLPIRGALNVEERQPS